MRGVNTNRIKIIVIDYHKKYTIIIKVSIQIPSHSTMRVGLCRQGFCLTRQAARFLTQRPVEENELGSRLGSEGRSTSTTISFFFHSEAPGQYGFDYADQKLLSFTDNRQDAALQSGHFNDLMKVVQLRSAIYYALLLRKELNHANLAQAIFDALKLAQEEYAQHPSTFPAGMRDNEKALKDLITYRALYDLRRGWRVVLPNLEQCALLEIDYKNLPENCESDESWQHVPFIKDLTHSERIELIYNVLDYFRKAYALFSNEYLSPTAIDETSK